MLTPTVEHLRRALEIKQQILKLEGELSQILHLNGNGETPTKLRRSVSAETREKIAAAARARWARQRKTRP